MIQVTLFDTQTALKIVPEQVTKLVQAFLIWKEISCEEVIVHFVDKETISEIHADHFDDPSPTDCITFPIDSPSETPCSLLGEVFICPQVAAEQALEFGSEVYRECSLYLVHTLLHLIGYGDESDEEAQEMRRLEHEALNYLEDQNLLLHYPK